MTFERVWRRQLPASLIAACVSVAGLFLLNAYPAVAAQTCTSASHCYVLAEQGPEGQGAFSGETSFIHAQCLSDSSSAYFVTAEMWLADNAANDWIEAGIAYGSPVGDRKYFYTAEQPQNGRPYVERDDMVNSVSSSQGYGMEIYRRTSTTFYASSGPDTVATGSWSSNHSFDLLQTGTETSGGSATVFASSYNLGYYNSSDNYVDGWKYGSYNVYGDLVPNSWGFVTDVAQNHHYRYGTVTSC